MSIYFDKNGEPTDLATLVDDCFDRDGQPISLEQYVALHEDKGYQRIAVDYNADESICVSTVWLGINHNWDDTGPPIIFETMVFGGPHDQEQWRYATEAAALAGQICSAYLREGGRA